jgi:aminopeptidase-like protein
LARTLYGFFAGYHNSLDTKEFMGIPTLVRSIQEVEQILQTQEMGSCYVNLKPYGEPHLGPRGLYPNENSVSTWTKSTDDLVDSRQFLNRMLTILNYADGDHDMMDIATRCGCKLNGLSDVVEKLEQSGLLAHKGK